ncbi:NmrA family protein [Cladochytrium replicatum]|nr:NmrA family protein [Cladochytrium replicatum]
MAIGVAAATGQLGKLIVQYLAAKGLPVIALARNPENVATPGVEKRQLDYGSPSSSALAGVTVFVLISSGSFEPPRLEQHKRAIDAAKAAGVKHIFYTSILRASTSPLVLAADHKATEEYLEETGIPFTSLRNGWYLENWLGTIDSILASGSILGSTHGAKVSPASRIDYAEATANVVAKAYAGESVKKYYELGGAPITLDELAAEISAKAGKSVKYVDLSQADYAKTLEGFGLPAGIAFIFSQSSESASQGGLFTDSKDLEEVLGHAPENWRDVVKRFVK